VVIVLIALSQAGATVKGAYDFLISMSVISYTLPFVLLFVVQIVVQTRPAPSGEWTAPGGATAGRVIGWVGLVVTLSAIACTLIPSPDAVDKVGAVVKLIVASGALIGWGVIIYGVARVRRSISATRRTDAAASGDAFDAVFDGKGGIDEPRSVDVQRRIIGKSDRLPGNAQEVLMDNALIGVVVEDLGGILARRHVGDLDDRGAGLGLGHALIRAGRFEEGVARADFHPDVATRLFDPGDRHFDERGAGRLSGQGEHHQAPRDERRASRGGRATAMDWRPSHEFP